MLCIFATDFLKKKTSFLQLEGKRVWIGEEQINDVSY